MCRMLGRFLSLTERTYASAKLAQQRFVSTALVYHLELIWVSIEACSYVLHVSATPQFQ